ncbi:transglycosylase SLT domain-containing protein [Leucobacter sp. HNU]|uniref:aggregation-promoting factor C-terminal-like domain-containing protein n=1 Tax=Leucobacter sp. HNU TaxID=3236805 RepID=UPI003A80388F
MASATAVLAFVGTLSVVPYTAPNAYADQEFLATQDQRLHQQFVPATATEASFDLAASPIELVPEAKPKKVATVDPAESQTDASTKQPDASEPPMYTGGGSPALWMETVGIPKSDWGYVDYIVSHESTWNPNAINPTSRTCGLVQIDPMHGVANCTNPIVNLRWGDAYAKSKGGWKASYELWVSQGWW